MYRYAIYWVPPRDSRLWHAGTTWLGRDPETGARHDTPAVAGYTSARLRQIGAAARRYGFHATVKPPFRLTAACTAAQLRGALAQFCERHAAFALPPLHVATLDGFVALCPTTPCAQGAELAFECVRSLDRFRAAPSSEELARRRAAGLTPAQEQALLRYGYPYVGESFRFHLTLTDRLDSVDRGRLLPVIAQAFAAALAEPIRWRELALFGEPEPETEFVLLERFALAPARVVRDDPDPGAAGRSGT